MGRRQLVLLTFFVGSLYAQPPQLTSWYCGGSPTAAFSTVALSGTITCQQTMTASPDVQAYFDNFGNVTPQTAGTTSETVTPTATAYYSIKMQSNTLGWGTFSTVAANGNLVPNFAAISPNLVYGNIYQWPIFYGPGTLAVTVTQNTTTPGANGQPAVVTVTMSTTGCTAFWQGGSACSSITSPYETAIGRLVCTGAGGRIEWVDAIFSPQVSGANKWDFNFTWPIAESVSCSGAIGFGSNYALINPQIFNFIANGGSNWSPHLVIDSSQPFLFQETGSVKPWFAIQALPFSSNFTSPLQWNEPGYAEVSLASPWMKWGESSQTGINLMGLTEPNPPGDYTIWQGCINTHNPNSSWLGTCHAAEAGPLPGIGTNQAALNTFNTFGIPLESAALIMRDFKQAGLHTHYELVRQCNISGAYALIGTATSNDCNTNDQDASTIAFVNALRIVGDRLRPYLDIIKLGSFNPAGFVGPGIQFYWFAPALARQWPFLVSSEPAPVCPSGCLFSTGRGQQDVGAPYGQYSTIAENPSLGLPGDLDFVYNSVSNATHVLYTNTLMPNITSESGNFSPVPDADHCAGVGSCNERFPIYLWWNQLAWNVTGGFTGGANQCLNNPINSGAETNSCVGASQEKVQASHYQNHMNDLDPALTTISFGTATPCAGHTWKTAGYNSTRDVVLWNFDSSARTTCAGNIRMNVPAAMSGYWFDPSLGTTLSSVSLSAGTQNISVPNMGPLHGAVVLRLRNNTLPTQPLITLTDLPQAIAGTAYPSTALTCVGGSGSGYTFAITYGNLPSGMSLNGATGVISGTPTNGIVDNFHVGIDCLDGGGHHSTQSNGQGRQDYLFVVRPKINFPQGTINYYARASTTSPAFTSSVNNGPSIDGGAVGVRCSITGTFTNTGVIGNNNLCGFTGNVNVGATGTDTVSLTATDGAGATATTTMNLIAVTAPAVNPNGPGDFPGGQLPLICTQNVYCRTNALSAFSTGTIGSRTWTITGLPSGLTYATQNPNIAGTTSASPNNYAIAASFTDSSGTSNTYNGFITVVAPVSISTSSIPSGTVNTPYMACPTFTGGTYPNALLAYNSTLPAGFFVAPRSGCIYGTTSIAGTYNFNYQVIDRYGSQQTVPLSLVIGSGSVTIPQPLDTVTINYTGTSTPYLFKISRLFKQGEFPPGDCPQVYLDGTTLETTQYDGKNTYADGSALRGVVAAVFTLTPGSHTIQFALQTSSCTGTPLSIATMLGAGYNFESALSLVNGSTLTTSARTILSGAGSCPAWHSAVLAACQLWTSGSVAQTVELGDFTNASTCNTHPCSSNDIGFDSNKSLRPITYATFVPGLGTSGAVYVEQVVEDSDINRLQDQSYSITWTVGNTSPTTCYTSPGMITHYAMSRWIKRCWIGYTPPAASTLTINQNLVYEASTGQFDNYDANSGPAGSVLSHNYGLFTTAQSSPGCDIYQPCTIDTTWGAGGGSSEQIGPYPDWAINCFYSGDYRPCTEMYTNADEAASAVVHIREGTTTAKLLRGDASGTGLALAFSGYANPSISQFNFTCLSTCTNTIPFLGTWNPNDQHISDFDRIPYELTGDPFYLEEEEFWGSWSVFDVFVSTGLRSSSPAIQFLVGGIRGSAWLIRAQVNARTTAPDSDTLKNYFTCTLTDQFVTYEGIFSIPSDMSACPSTGTVSIANIYAYGSSVRGVTNPNFSQVFTNAQSPYAVSPIHSVFGGNGSASFAECNYGSLNCTNIAGYATASGTSLTFSSTVACQALIQNQTLNTSQNGLQIHIVDNPSTDCPTLTMDQAQNTSTSYQINAATWLGGTATFTTNGNNFLATGQPIVISGLTPSGYNVTGTVASGSGAAGSTTFTVAIVGNPGGNCSNCGVNTTVVNSTADTLLKVDDVYAAVSGFEHLYFYYSIGHAVDLGYATQPLLDYFMYLPINLLASTTPYYTMGGRWGVTLSSTGNNYITTISSLSSTENPAWESGGYLGQMCGDCYGAYLRNAIAYATNTTGGSTSWNSFIVPNIIPNIAWTTQLGAAKWSQDPRNASPPVSGVGTSYAGPRTKKGPQTSN